MIEESISHTFLFKSKCKKCFTSPKYYLPIPTTFGFKYHSDDFDYANTSLKRSLKFLKRTPSTYSPKQLIQLSMNQLGTPFISYNPKFHVRQINTNPIFIGNYVCECGFTFWAFNESRSKLAENKNSKRVKI